MKKVKLQNEVIPPIALGTWSWGTGQGGGDAIFGNHLTAEDLKPVFDAAMKAGLHLWDTATVYGMGASESILGEFTKGRDDVLLSTKFTPQLGGPVEDRLNSSLDRLGADQTWIHNPLDVKRWTPELIPLMKCGKVKYAGVSNHTLEEIQLAQSILAEEGLNISAVQNHYSLLYRSSEEAGIIDYCNENNIVFFSYMVLEQGALTDKYNAKNPLPSGTRRGEAFDEDVLAKLEGLIHAMKEVGNHHNANSAQVAIAWAIAKGTVPIIGVTRTSQIADAVKAAEITLTAQEVHDLEAAAKETGIVIKGEWEKPMH